MKFHFSVGFSANLNPPWIPPGGVALDYQRQLLEEQQQPYEAIFELPHGQPVTVGGESFQGPEAMFQPSLCAWDLQIHGGHGEGHGFFGKMMGF